LGRSPFGAERCGKRRVAPSGQSFLAKRAALRGRTSWQKAKAAEINSATFIKFHTGQSVQFFLRRVQFFQQKPSAWKPITEFCKSPADTEFGDSSSSEQ
jgi:hypothetical protein